jgi:dipeptidyl aminopeptidase/acylaminoacyl peptidase
VGVLELPDGAFQPVREAFPLALDPAWIAMPESLEFATGSGERAHGFLYRPANPDCRGEPGRRPPLLVKSHGGPTAATSSALDLAVQFWTSRGFALLDVNYRGSTGFGRAYRDRLRGEWGIVDVEDCVQAARFAAAEDVADPARLAIRGGSAGGYTTLCALTFHDVFQAGASYYGIGDLEALARDTHKFESRYLDRLVGPYPERRDLYRSRSPIHHAEQLSCPVIFFQGLEDRVVPPAQSEAMAAALAERGIPYAYVPFAGEQHGFRRAESQRTALEGELYFYARVFGFPTGAAPPGVEIVGLAR